MTVSGAPDSAALDQKQAEVLGRFFNMAFGSALLYGSRHQSTAENAAGFYAQLSLAHNNHQSITLIVERESVYFESVCVDKMVNCRRIVAYFKKAGIQSISFEAGVERAEVQAMMRILGDCSEGPSVSAIESLMRSAGIRNIKVNYIVYRKVTADEAIVDKQRSAAAEGVSGAGRAGAGDKRLGLSIRNLLGEFSAVSAAFKSKAFGQSESGGEGVASQLRDIAIRIQSEGTDSKPVEASELAEAVAALRSDVDRSMEMLRTAGTLDSASDPVATALDNLSCETIIRIIRDEYRHGAVSVKRLAQIIRRLLPDLRELKAALSGLRAGLTADGMSLSDYLQLVNSLVRELNDEGLTENLREASEQMGVSVDEIVSAIKADPNEAARLIVIASEIKNGNGGSERLSEVLADYIEQASGRSAVASGPVEGGQADVQAALQRYKSLMLDALGKNGVHDEVIKRIGQKISTKKRGFDLPRGIFDIKVTAFFLDHEVKRYLRYNTPFSTMAISYAGARAGGVFTAADCTDIVARVIPHTLTALKKMLRDLDLVGVMLWLSENVPFIILPMTDEVGAQSVQKRLYRELNRMEFSGLPNAIKPVFAITVQTFNRAETPDCDSFIKKIMAQHNEALMRARMSVMEK